MFEMRKGLGVFAAAALALKSAAHRGAAAKQAAFAVIGVIALAVAL